MHVIEKHDYGSHTASKKKWRLLLKWSQRIFTLLAFVFIGQYAWSVQDQLRTLLYGTNYFYLITSIFAWMTLNFIAAASSAQLLNTAGIAISYKRILRIHVQNLPARYIPGGIWHTLGRASHFFQLGISAKQLATFVLLENTMAAGTALAIGGFGVHYFCRVEGWSFLSSLAFFSGATFLIIAPLAVNFRRATAFSRILLPHYLKAMLWTVLFWISVGAIFTGYLSAFPSIVNEIHPLEAGTGYLFSWGIGFITLFSPQGIGVSEAIFSNIYPIKVSFGNVLVLVAGFRIIIFILMGKI